MKAPEFTNSAYDLRVTDADLAHLRTMVQAESRSVSPVFPLPYWRRRVVVVMATRHLLPAQLAVASALLAQIDCAAEVQVELAKYA